jgi:FkbM family methyltransferase
VYHFGILFSRLLYYAESIGTLLVGVRNWPILLPAFLGWPLRKPYEIALRSGLRFRVREPMDVWSVKESCLDRFYEKASVPLRPDWTVVDIGGGLGDFTVFAAHRCPAGRIYAYEPFPSSFALLEENVRLNGIGNVRAFPLAVTGSRGETLAIEELATPLQNRTVGSSPGRGGAGAVRGTTLEDVFAENGLAVCDFLKIDCEGGEYEILFRCPPAVLARIRTICLEYHDGVTPHSHEDLVRFLEGNGFRVNLLPNRVHVELGYLHAENPAFASKPAAAAAG